MGESTKGDFEARKYSTIETLLLVVGECIEDMVRIHEDAIELPLAHEVYQMLDDDDRTSFVDLLLNVYFSYDSLGQSKL